MKKSKVMKITAIAVVIVLIAGAVIWKMLGIRAEGEENQGTTQIDTSKWDTENRVNIVYDEDGVPVPVPKGYTASSILREFDGEGNKTKDGERTVNTGFVIYEGEEDIISDATKAMEEGEEKNQAIENDIYNAQTTRNQWVWVPVENMSDIYFIYEDGKKYGQLWDFTDTGRTKRIRSQYSGYSEPHVIRSYWNNTNDDSANLYKRLSEETMTSLNLELQDDFENTIASIEKYGGFYIGRYELGDLSKQKVKLVKGNTDIDRQNWYTLYRKSKAIFQKENENVRTSIIWGSLWDHTLEWLVNTKFTDADGNKDYSKVASDSTSWGNYANSTFTYKNENGNISTKSQGDKIMIPTGSTEYTNANNIYDLAGNVRDWTLSGGRDYRGGYSQSQGSSSPAREYGTMAPYSNKLGYSDIRSTNYALCEIVRYSITRYYEI